MPPRKKEDSRVSEDMSSSSTKVRVIVRDDDSLLGKKMPEKSIKFVVVGGTLEVANTLRRILLSEVVTVAPVYDQYNLQDPSKNDVVITANTTALHDQIMGVRISMIPIHMSRIRISTHERSELKFVLDSVNKKDLPVDVTTEDVKIYDADGSPLPTAQTSTYLPPDPFTGDYPIIARLKPLEVFKAEFYGRRTIARENPRCSPVSTCAMSYVVDEKLAKADLDARLAAEPPENHDQIREHHRSIDRQRCYQVDEIGEALEIAFHVESECGMSAADVVLSAFDVMLGKIDALERNMRVRGAHKDDPAFFHVDLEDEDHSMGNLYQAMCFRLYPKELDYIGYMMPHPQVRHVVFKIKLARGEEGGEDEETRLDAFLARSRGDIRAHVERVRQTFSEAVGTL